MKEVKSSLAGQDKKNMAGKIRQNNIVFSALKEYRYDSNYTFHKLAGGL